MILLGGGAVMEAVKTGIGSSVLILPLISTQAFDVRLSVTGRLRRKSCCLTGVCEFLG